MVDLCQSMSGPDRSRRRKPSFARCSRTIRTMRKRWCFSGTIQTAKNAPAEAENHFKTAIEKKPADAAGYRALAELYMRDSKRDDAVNVVRAGLKQQPGNFALRLSLAGLLEAKKDYEGAIAEYESMLKDTPSSLIVANNLASLLADHRTDKASLERANSLAAVSRIPNFRSSRTRSAGSAISGRTTAPPSRCWKMRPRRCPMWRWFAITSGWLILRRVRTTRRASSSRRRARLRRRRRAWCENRRCAKNRPEKAKGLEPFIGRRSLEDQDRSACYCNVGKTSPTARCCRMSARCCSTGSKTEGLPIRLKL